MSAARRSITLALALLVALPVLPLAPTAAALTVNPSCFSTNRAVDVTLVIDRSGSMTAHDNNSPTSRMQDAQTAATQFLQSLGPNDQSSLISFSTDYTIDQSMTHNHAQTIWHEQHLVPYGFTLMWAGIRLGLYELENQIDYGLPVSDESNRTARLGDPNVQQVLILLTDGAQTDYNGFNQNPPGSPSPIDEAQWGKNRGAMIFSIAVGSNADLIPWLPVVAAVATSPQHAFQAPSGPGLQTALTNIFSQIRVQMRDAAAPTVGLVSPAPAQAYANGAPAGFASPFGSEPAIRHNAPVTSVAGDDCLVSSVRYTVDVYHAGAYQNTVALDDTNNATAPYASTINCDALPAGRHVLHALVTDFVAKTNADARPFWCIHPSEVAIATAAYGRNTNPPDVGFSSPGVALPSAVGGTAQSITANLHKVQAPLEVDLSLLFENATSLRPFPSGEPSDLAASALARVANLTVNSPVLNEKLRLLEAQANVSVLADTPFGVPWPLATSGRTETYALTGAPLPVQDTDQPLNCQVIAVPGSVPTQQCIGKVVVLPDGLTVLFHEELLRSGPGFTERTVNALHILRDRADQRSELILGQAYAGASLIGPEVLAGPVRNLSYQNDAGTGGDVSGSVPLAVNPGTYQGRVADASDVDAYTLQVDPGQKLHVALVPGDGAFVTLKAQPQLPGAPVPPAVAAKTPGLALKLFAPDGSLRQDAEPAAGGAAVYVELNVDQPGPWRFEVGGARGASGDYTLQVTRADAPVIKGNDALLLRDAPSTCADAALIGPGAHVGALEYQDPADAYRFQAYEGQTVAVVLRPGDTVEAADMDLSFYAPDCTLLRAGHAHGPVKGYPEIMTYVVPPGASGLYRAVVEHVNGIGTYELVVAGVQAT